MVGAALVGYVDCWGHHFIEGIMPKHESLGFILTKNVWELFMKVIIEFLKAINQFNTMGRKKEHNPFLFKI